MGRKKKQPEPEVIEEVLPPSYEQGSEQDEQQPKQEEKPVKEQVPGKYRKFQGEKI